MTDITAMFFKKYTPPPIIPLDRQTYIKRISVMFIGQIILATIMVWFLSSDYVHEKYGNYVILTLIGSAGLFLSISFKHCNFAGRFKDIYPEYKPSHYVIPILLFFPLLMIFYVTFLGWKDKSSKAAPMKFLYRPLYLLLLAVPLACLQFQSVSTAYWMASPSVSAGVNILERYDVLRSSPKDVSGSYVDHYLNEKTTILRGAEVALLIARASKERLKQLDREPASIDKKDIKLKLKYTFLILSDLNKILVKSEENSLQFRDYSFVQWVSPSGPLEIMLLASFDRELSQGVQKSLVKSCHNLIKGSEKLLEKVPEDQRGPFHIEIAKLKNQFQKTKAFRNINLG